MSLHSVIQTVTTKTAANAPTLLAASAVVGVVSTALLTGSASFRAASILSENPVGGSDAKEKFINSTKLVWKEYIPPALTCATTIAAIIAGHRVSAARTAAFASLYSISERALSDYKDKVVEQLGKNKEEKIRHDLAQDKTDEVVAANPTVVFTEGKTLCVDSYSGRPFTSNIEDLRGGVNKFNAEVLSEGYGSLNRLYDFIGLAPTANGDYVGWSSDDILEARYSSTLVEGTKPAFVIDFHNHPEPRFNYFN